MSYTSYNCLFIYLFIFAKQQNNNLFPSTNISIQIIFSLDNSRNF